MPHIVNDEPFDPKLPNRLRHLLAAIAAGHQFAGLDDDHIWLFEYGNERLSLAEMTQLLQRLAYAERTRAELADKCAAYRNKRDELRTEVGRLQGNLSAVRGWTRSRLEVLSDRRRDNPDSLVNAGKTAVLDDLTRVLDHLDTIPAPNAAAVPAGAFDPGDGKGLDED